MNRRDFLKVGTVAATGGLLAGSLSASPTSPSMQQTKPDTRWRGFNLLEFFSPQPSRPLAPFREQDLEIMATWGFNFARIPMSYWAWAKPDKARWLQIDEKPFEHIDNLVRQGRKHGVHINLNLHRIPGYCINGRELEPVDLFKGAAENRAEALKAACHHWRFIARRYKGVPNTELSFDLINEPPHMKSGDYAAVAKALILAIRDEDPSRLIVSDGIDVGRTPVHELVELGVMQSGRGYDPVRVSHHQAPWMPDEMKPGIPMPTWPLTLENGVRWDKETLREKLVAPWKAIEAKGVKVHMGEWGAYNRTAHPVVLAWMSDLLSLWKEAGWGWAVWNLRGDFGPLDSKRTDVKYEDFKGHKLDRAMLELLQAG